MHARELNVGVVSPDRSWLRRLALLLEEFGYRPTAYTDFDAAESALRMSPADFLLLDAAALAGDCTRLALLKQSLPGHLHVLLFQEAGQSVDQLSALEAGVDDFLKQPFSAGEVLARLRAGVRYNEFERRLERGEWVDSATGLWTRAALLGRIEQERAKPDHARRAVVLALEIDRFSPLTAQYGATGAGQIMQQAARAVEDDCGAGHFVALIAAGRLGILLPEASLDKAEKLAESVRLAIAGIELPEVHGELRLTASIGLAAGDAKDDAAHQMLDRAEQALRDAQRSGGDMGASFHQFDEERRLWLEKIRSGHPLECSTARDVMTPLTLSLRTSDTIACAAALFAQTQLDVLPVFDAANHLAGVIESEQIRAAIDGSRRSGQSLEQIIERDVALLADCTAFAAIIDQFIQQERSLLVVTRDERPVGYIARERFLSLVKPIQSELFAPSVPFTPGSEYLVVPDAVEVE